MSLAAADSQLLAVARRLDPPWILFEDGLGAALSTMSEFPPDFILLRSVPIE